MTEESTDLVEAAGDDLQDAEADGLEDDLGVAGVAQMKTSMSRALVVCCRYVKHF